MILSKLAEAVSSLVDYRTGRRKELFALSIEPLFEVTTLYHERLLARLRACRRALRRKTTATKFARQLEDDINCLAPLRALAAPEIGSLKKARWCTPPMSNFFSVVWAYYDRPADGEREGMQRLVASNVIGHVNPTYHRIQLAPEIVNHPAGRKLLDRYFADAIVDLERRYADLCNCYATVKSEFTRR
ncbi:MAG TPA: hypothetical protein VHE81_20165 [Lacipirellulaceae bacterium]|nr:hypothetical protein [Lacipirellulaceae bacterium]